MCTAFILIISHISGIILTRHLGSSGNLQIPAQNISPSALTIGYNQIVTSATATSTNQAVAGLSVTVTIPSGGRKIKITAFSPQLYNTSSPSNSDLQIWDGSVGGTGTQLAFSRVTSGGNNYCAPAIAIAIVTPAAGSKTYCVGLSNVGGTTATLGAFSNSPAYIHVEAI